VVQNVQILDPIIPISMYVSFDIEKLIYLSNKYWSAHEFCLVHCMNRTLCILWITILYHPNSSKVEYMTIKRNSYQHFTRILLIFHWTFSAHLRVQLVQLFFFESIEVSYVFGLKCILFFIPSRIKSLSWCQVTSNGKLLT
jgi:hypothetical protein